VLWADLAEHQDALRCRRLPPPGSTRLPDVDDDKLRCDSELCLKCAGGDVRLGDRLTSSEGTCVSCGAAGATFRIHDIAQAVDSIYAQIVARDDPVAGLLGKLKTPAAVIEELLGEPHPGVARTVANCLSEAESKDVADGKEPRYADEEFYSIEFRTSNELEERWERFEAGVKYGGRFFRHDERNFLDEIFRPLLSGELHGGTAPIVTLGPESEIKTVFRGRVANSFDDQKRILENPTRELAPPPPRLRTAGRMNVAGTAAFYGCVDVATCVAELAVPFGGTAIVGGFAFIKPVRVLDMRLLSRAGTQQSYFEPNLIRNVEYSRFMRSLRNLLRAPIVESDRALDYLPTQMVAEYLAQICDLDGVITVSSVAPEAAREKSFEDIDDFNAGEEELELKTGINIVLFPHAAGVVGSLSEPRRTVKSISGPLLPWISRRGGSMFVVETGDPPMNLSDSDYMADPYFGDAWEPTLELREETLVLAQPRAITYDVATSWLLIGQPHKIDDPLDLRRSAFGTPEPRDG
jgi:RES domain